MTDTRTDLASVETPPDTPLHVVSIVQRLLDLGDTVASVTRGNHVWRITHYTGGTMLCITEVIG